MQEANIGPKVGTIGRRGLLKSSVFVGTPLFQNAYAISLEFVSKHNNAHWYLTNVYAPCSYAGKRDFLEWFSNIQMPDSLDWIIVGDFNLYRNPSDRNRPGADFSEMMLFNEAISSLGLVELPLKGRRFTWSNKQQSPLLERLDWFFTSAAWTLTYPNSFAYPLVMETSDHVPCVISVSTAIPKHFLFRFENYWLHHPEFFNVVQNSWGYDPPLSDPAKFLTAKFKNLRAALKEWKRSISNLKNNISNVKLILTFLCLIEELRDLSVVEWNFKRILETKLQALLKQQKSY